MGISCANIGDLEDGASKDKEEIYLSLYETRGNSNYLPATHNTNN